MKTVILTLFTIAMLHSPAAAQRYDDGAKVSFGVFYSSLGHYGEWISVGASAYAWRPGRVERDWRPYSVGHWGWTDDGWYWMSDEPWGWATYHYGRWYYDDYYGWLWIPGYEWAPAWVEWRYGNDCVGWAPLGPYAVFSLNFGIYYRTRWVTPYNYWCFVDWRYINTPSVGRYIYRSDNNRRYVGVTRGAGSVRYNGGRIVSRGPEPGLAERRANIRLRTAEIVDVHEPSERGVVRSDGGERIEAYRPRIDERSINDQRPEKVREGGRAVSLDMKYTTIRSQELDRRTGRDLRRAEEYRVRRERALENQRNRNESPGLAAPRAPETSRRDVNQTPREQRRAQPERSTQPRPSVRERQPERSAQPRPSVRERQQERSVQPRPSVRERQQERSVQPRPSVRERQQERRAVQPAPRQAPQRSAPPSRESRSRSGERRR